MKMDAHRILCHCKTHSIKYVLLLKNGPDLKITLLNQRPIRLSVKNRL